MPIIKTYQDPIGLRDIKITNDWDIVIESTPSHNKVSLTGKNDPTETMIQILRMCLQTKRNEYLKNMEFGASPKRYKNLIMTAQALSDIRSYIQIHLNNSFFNQKDYPIDVVVFPITKDTIGVKVTMFLSLINLDKNMIEVKAVFNHSTQELKTVYKAFGG